MGSAEPLLDAYSRASRFLLEITQLVLKADVAVISHGLMIALMVCAANGYSPARVWDFPQANAGIQAFRTRDGQIDSQESWNHAAFG